MGTPISFIGNSVYYAGGSSGASNVVGWESSRTRVVRYKFTAPPEGASRFAFSIGTHYLGGGSASAPLRFYVGESDTSHANAGKDAEYHGTVTMTKENGEYLASGDANILLLPNTTYYLWIFPGSETYSWFEWYGNVKTATAYGAAGLVSIDTGSEIIKAIPFVDDGERLRQLMPHIEDGNKWNLCS